MLTWQFEAQAAVERRLKAEGCVEDVPGYLARVAKREVYEQVLLSSDYRAGAAGLIFDHLWFCSSHRLRVYPEFERDIERALRESLGRVEDKGGDLGRGKRSALQEHENALWHRLRWDAVLAVFDLARMLESVRSAPWYFNRRSIEEAAAGRVTEAARLRDQAIRASAVVAEDVPKMPAVYTEEQIYSAAEAAAKIFDPVRSQARLRTTRSLVNSYHQVDKAWTDSEALAASYGPAVSGLRTWGWKYAWPSDTALENLRWHDLLACRRTLREWPSTSSTDAHRLSA